MIFGVSPGVEEVDLDTVRLLEEGVRWWRRDGVEEGVPVIREKKINQSSSFRRMSNIFERERESEGLTRFWCSFC